MAITITELNGTNCRCYLLASGSRAALVDPVRERLSTYKTMLEEYGLTLDFVIETHMHADHLMMNRATKEALGVPVIMHRTSPSPLVDRHVDDKQEITLGSDSIQFFHTPGHTPDSMVIRVAGAVLTGDTLMIGGSGRTDFPGGDAGSQFDAVTQRLWDLPDNTVVWPGHDYKGREKSTIGIEKKENPRFLGQSRESYVELMGKLGLPFPDRIQSALQINQSGFEAHEVTFPLVQDVCRVESIDPPQLAKWLSSDSPPIVVDVREPEEFTGELGHIQGALLVPLDALATRLPKLAGYMDRDIVMVCRAGARSATASAILSQAGFRRPVNLTGGMLAWTGEGLPVQR